MLSSLENNLYKSISKITKGYRECKSCKFVGANFYSHCLKCKCSGRRNNPAWTANDKFKKTVFRVIDKVLKLVTNDLENA